MSERPLISSDKSEAASEAALFAWKNFCRSIESSIPEQAFETWFQPIVPISFENNTLQIKVPGKFYYDWIEGHYSPQIEHALNESLGESVRLVYSSNNSENLIVTQDVSETEEDLVSLPVAENLPKKKTVYTSSGDSNLNHRYTFDNFIEGPQNRFARAASLAVAKSPAKTAYNPLLIYGGVGLGKTHLMQAIGQKAIKHHPDIRIKYIDIENFTQQFVESIKQNRADAFSSRYKAVDLLLLDDIQFLAGRERTEMEFFHIFNTLHQTGKQIVITSDKPPRELKGLDERLVSRIGWGLVCDIGPPDFDTRVAIVERFAEQEGIILDTEISHLLAENFTRNVRDLQGALIRLIAFSSLSNTPLDLSQAKLTLKDLVETREIRVPIDTVQHVVAIHFNIPADLLIAKIRSQPVARARMVAMALGIKLCGMSLKQVGRHFGNRDHTTVLHARKSIDKWIKNDSDFAIVFNKLIRNIESQAA